MREAGTLRGKVHMVHPAPFGDEEDALSEEEIDAGRGAFRRSNNLLLDYPEERQRWFAFRDARLREAMQEWLEEHEIEPTTAPRERGSDLSHFPSPGKGEGLGDA